MKVDENYGPPGELQFHTNVISYPNKRMSSSMSSNQSQGTDGYSKCYNEKFTVPPSSAHDNNARNKKVIHNITPIQHVLKKSLCVNRSMKKVSIDALKDKLTLVYLRSMEVLQ